MTKVLIVMQRLWTGGIQKVNIDMASHIKDPDIEVALVSLYPRQNTNFEREAEEKGLKTFYLDKKPGLDLSMIPKLNKLIREYKPDVIHLNQRTTIYALVPTILNHVGKRFYAVHSMPGFDAKGKAKLINKIAFKCFGFTPIAISDTCKKALCDYYDMPDNKVVCIYNGIDTDKFKRETPYEDLDKDTCTFVTACAFKPEKNIPLLVNAFARVYKCCPDARLTIVGSGADMDKVKEEIRKNHIEDVVNLPGMQSDVHKYLDRSHVYVSSSDVEGLPISTLEAMSNGLPIVSTNVGGVPDIVENNGNGFLVPRQDAMALSDAMITLCKNKGLRKEFSKHSEELSEKYSIQACADSYARLYRKQ